jgi:hypothetical protein
MKPVLHLLASCLLVVGVGHNPGQGIVFISIYDINCKYFNMYVYFSGGGRI